MNQVTFDDDQDHPMDIEKLRRADDLIIGELIAQVRILTQQVNILQNKIEKLEAVNNREQGAIWLARISLPALGAAAYWVAERLHIIR
jgi:hypothetical protein